MKWIRQAHHKQLVGVLLAFIIVVAYAVPVLATAQPDTAPTITNIHVNRNLYVTDDVLVYGEYYIPYASLPTDPASDTYNIRIFENTTELGSVSPYSSSTFDNGYNHQVFGVYFESSFNWTDTHLIRLSQSPSFSPANSWDFSITAGEYTGETAQADNRDEVKTYILEAAERMEGYYENVTMVDSMADGQVLSSPTGETYFRGAIDGIQSLVPGLFYVQSASTGDMAPHTWTTTQFDAYEQRFNGTWVGNDTAATAEQFGGTEQATMALIFTVPLCVGSVIFSSVKFKKVEPGFIVSFLMIIMSGMMGWFPTAILASLLQLCSIYLGYIFFYSRG